jgi:nicotinamidase-related amidase
MKIKTMEDGWDCVPELQEAVDFIEELNEFTYEIKSCVRDQDLDYMVEEMMQKLREAINVLEEIDTDQEFETVNYLEEE